MVTVCPSHFATRRPLFYLLFFFNDRAPTEIYTFPLHDALPISPLGIAALQQRIADGFRPPVVIEADHVHRPVFFRRCEPRLVALLFHLAEVLSTRRRGVPRNEDRKSTRLNSSHLVISYAVFCLK